MRTTQKNIPSQKNIWAGRFAYLSLGLGLAVWASLIPYAKNRLHVNEAELGFLLLFVGIGAIAAMPFTGRLIDRLGCRALQNIFIPSFFLCLIIASFISNIAGFAVFVFLIGASSGILDVVMNVQAALLEEHTKRRLMANFHGMCMLGVGIGAGLMTLLLQFSQKFLAPPLSQNPITATLVLSLLTVLAALYFQQYFFPKTSKNHKQEKTPLFILPRGILFWLGVICFFTYMIEGVLMDWSALFMHEERGIPLSQANIGYALFALTMTAGRFGGDWLGTRLGTRSVLFYGVLFCIAGFLVIAIVPNIHITLFTFFMLGFFASNTGPMLFFLVTKNTDDVCSGIAGVTTFGFLGLLAGPALMGFVAHNLGLVCIFHAMALFLALVILILIKLKVRE